MASSIFRRLLAFAAAPLLLAAPAAAQFTAPPRGLDTLTGRKLSFGYLNALRRTTGSVAEQMAKLNYGGVDVVLLAFASLNANGTLGMTGRAADFRAPLLAAAHARSKSVLFSVTGNFDVVAASAATRQALANSVVDMLEAHGFDGVDFDWEWPNTAERRSNFTAMMQAVHAAVKARSPNYIVCFVQGPGYWLAGTDWAAVRSFSDFCFMICYDWKNPANGPIRKPGSVQYLGLSGGTIEASGKGAIDFAVAAGYPVDRLILGMPFYGSNNVSWFSVSDLWSADRIGMLAATDADSREVLIDGGWHTSPDCVKRKMDALLDTRTSVLSGAAAVRGVGFWEFGHEDTDDPQLSSSIAAWRAGDRSVSSPAAAPPAGTVTLIDHGSGWRYYDAAAAPPAVWKERTFNDSSWRLGETPLGYGDGDEATVVDSANGRITTYCRRSFSVAAPASIGALTLRLVRDDGAAVYLNGAEVGRTNLPPGALTSATLATANVGGTEEKTQAWVTEIPPSLLVAGSNVLAVETHQSGASSSDISMDAELFASPRAEPVIVPAHSWWRFSDSAAAPAANWSATGFDDAAWPSGRGRLGYGNDGEWTPLLFGADPAVKPLAAWFRHTFILEGAGRYGSLRVRLQRDDGAIVYLNGTELFRDNLPEGVLTNSVRALSGQGGADETLWRTFIVPASALREGRNVVAVQVHQAALDSSDIGFDVELTGIVHPPLQATRSVAQLILTTSPGFSNWMPESTGSLNGVWTPVAATPVLSGGQVRYTLPAPAVRQYYRMRRTGD
ncbi:MAG TPA: glycoside hydrolase family 18 protein [Verrucomicrobiales bacterium]|nr:glycoside hydrolase family 18 protein [Verrucomicrobiales bacterium]